MTHTRDAESEQKRYVKRICVTLETLLRLHLNQPLQNAAHHFPIQPSVALLYLREYIRLWETDTISECTEEETEE